MLLTVSSFLSVRGFGTLVDGGSDRVTLHESAHLTRRGLRGGAQPHRDPRQLETGHGGPGRVTVSLPVGHDRVTRQLLRVTTGSRA
eukprot:3623935-Rhodomonas_salina.3